MSKKIKVILIAILVVITAVVIFLIARLIVDNGYDSLSRLAVEEYSESVKPSESSVIFEDDGTDSDRKRVVKLFDDSNIEERQSEFLGEDYDFYIDALSYIESVAEDTFSGIDENGSYAPDISFTPNDEFSLDYLGDYGHIQLLDSLCIVGMYGSHYIVYAYKYPYSVDPWLVVVDYSKAYSTTEVSTLLDFGQYMSLNINTDVCKLEDYEDFSILWVKE